MFESDDWDFDQDFLNDVDEKAVKFYSQADNQNDVDFVKRRKIENSNDASVSNSKNDNAVKETRIPSNVSQSSTDKSLRTNLILGIFNKVEPLKNDSQNASQVFKKPTNVDPLVSSNNVSTTQLPRKNLILDILKNKCGDDKVNHNNQDISKNEPRKTEQTKYELDTKDNFKSPKESTMFTNKATTSHAAKDLKSEQLKIMKNGEPRDDNVSSSLSNKRRDLLLNALQPSPVNNTISRKNIPKQSSHSTKNPQPQSNKKMTLVRRFPGPAGLLPDDINTSVPPISVLNNLEDNENDRRKEASDSNLSEYCSQNTKNLFTEGAWQLMLDDLPSNLLHGYEIATIKQTANASGCDSTKIQILAGMLEYIDHSHDNPPIILKDFTGSVRGLIHRDIPLKYPGLLEPNVVVLLKDVGLLKTSGSLIANKYHILISLSSLLAIYTNKGKIVHTPQIESFLQCYQDGKVKRNDQKSLKSHFRESNIKRSNIHDAREIKFGENDDWQMHFENDKGGINELFENVNESMNFDDEDDLLFSMSVDQLTNSQSKNNFTSSKSKIIERPNKTPKKRSSPKKENMLGIGEKKSKSLLDTLKKFTPDANKHKKLLHERVESTSNKLESDAAHLEISAKTFTEELSLNKKDFNSTESNIVEIKTTDRDKKSSPSGRNLNSANDTKVDNVKNKSMKKSEKGRLSVRSRLLQFKNDDVLTPPESTNSEVTETKTDSTSTKPNKSAEKKNSQTKEIKSFKDILCENDNDSDDEMMSQLDVDTIFSNYNNE